MSNPHIKKLNPYYKINYPNNTNLQIASAVNIIELLDNENNAAYQRLYSVYTAKITLISPDNKTTTLATTPAGSANIQLNLLGTYQIIYEGQTVTVYTDKTNSANNYSRYEPFKFTYKISAVENKLPLKKWTVTGVINRLLDVCEPLRKGEKPRFRLNGMDENGNIIPEGQEGSGQAALFDKILAPQFSLTRQTLRECLQEVGKVIHGEPRLRIKKDSAGKYYYEVIYDLYASQ